jgi:hypothetical protein
MTNWRAMQVSGALKAGTKGAPNLRGPAEVLTRHMVGGCWRSNLSKGGVFNAGTGSHSGGGGVAKKRAQIPPPGGWVSNNGILEGGRR